MADDQNDQQQADDAATDVDQTTDTADDGTDDGQDGADQLGDAGKKALDAMKAKWRAERDRAKALEQKLADAGKPAKDGDAPDADAIQAEADRRAQAKANDRILRSEVKAAAAGKLADPADAHRFLDLSKFEVDADGNVDQEELDDAIAELLTKKPYLAAAQSPQRRFQGSADSGARKEKPKTLVEQIEAAQKAGDTNLVFRLKARQATASK